MKKRKALLEIEAATEPSVADVAAMVLAALASRIECVSDVGVYSVWELAEVWHSEGVRRGHLSLSR